MLYEVITDPAEMLELHPDGTSSVTVLGSEIKRQVVQHVVPGGTWQGSRLVEGTPGRCQ